MDTIAGASRMLHILYVDDEEGFRELTELYLERADDVQVDTADSAETALAMMRHEAYDAVVSDFQMPGMDGVDLLRTIRASGATVPFVLFTGKGREDVVIEAFESGVDFYLQKGGDPVSQYAELLHKVRQAVAFHDAQQAQQRSDQFYRRLYNETPLGILHYDGDGTIVDCNDEFVAIIGSSREVLIGLNMLGELQDDELKRQVRHSLETGRGHYTGLYRSVTADKATHVRIIFKGMRDAKGAIYGGIGLVEDISAQISAEDRLAALAKEYETVFMGTQDAMFLVAVEGGAFRYIRNNRSHQELTGLSPEELQGKTPQDLVGPVMGDAISANYRRCIKERKSITYEETLDLRTGTKVWRTTLTPVFECERPAYIVGSSQDITKYRQALEAVAESRESYRRLVENLNEVIYTLDTRAKITYISPNIASIGGYEPSAILGRNFVDFVHPADKEARMEQFSKIIAGDLRPTEYRLLTKGGNPLWVRTSARPIVKGGDVVGVQGVLVDIDKRKRAELAVRDSELKYRTLFEDSRDAIWVTSADGRVIDANPAAFELMGYPRGEFVGIEARLLYANPADRDVFVRRIHRFGYVKDFEVRLKRKDGSSVLCTFTSHLWQDDEGGVIGYRGIVRDISEQKRLENTLRREARLQELLIDISSSFIGIPPERLDAAIGVSIAQLGEAFGADRAYIHAYDFEKKTASNTHEWCAPGIDACISSLQDVPFSVVGRGWVDSHRRGETIIIDDVSNLPNRNTERRKLKPQGIKSIITVPLMDGGECIGFVGFESVHDRYDFSGLGERILKIYANMLINVYNRRKMERELVAGERRLRTYIESAPEGIFVIDRDGYYRDVNERACCMTGYTRDELLSMSIRDIASPEASPGTMETYHTLLTKGEVQAELLLRRKDGSDFPASLKAIELSDSRYMGFCSDITEHKLAEQALRDSEERYRLITENMGDNVTMFDFSLSVVYTSPSIEKMRGYTVEEVMRQTPADMLTPESLKKVMDLYEEQMKLEATGSIGPNWTTTIEIEEYHKDGSIISVEATVSLLRDPNGAPTHIIIISRDITERIRSERALRLATKKLGILSEITRHDVNNKLAALMGFAELAREADSNPAAHEFLDRICSNALMIQEQLAFAKAYEGLGHLEPHWQGLAGILDTIGLPEWSCVAPSCTGMEVYADRMLRQVFVTLLDNTQRHGQGVRQIVISCEAVRGGLLIVWEDDGVGVQQEEKERIFERGFGKHTGLGLFLAREILAITDITICETGQPGVGARFEIFVPAGGYRSAR